MYALLYRSLSVCLGKVVQHSRTRPRGFSSPSTLEQVSPPPPDDSAFFSESAYDLPSNSRMLQALNVTLRRTTTPQSEYAKLSRSREALLLRSGVTLRRHTRESLSSMSSFASRLEGEEPAAGNSGPGTSDEEEDTLNKSVSACCVRAYCSYQARAWWPDSSQGLAGGLIQARA